MKDIIKFENKYISKNGKPEKPASKSKKTFISPILGTITDQRRKLDAKNFQTSEKLREAAGKLHTERKTRKALVIVEWDAMPDVEGYEKKFEAEEELVPNKGWKIDLDIELFENYHGHIEKESIGELDDIEMEVVEEEEEVELDSSNECEDVDEE